MKLSEKHKDTLFTVFILSIFEFICIIAFITISGLAGHLYWTVEQLTTTPEGMVIQILNLIIFVNGLVIFLYFVIFIILFITS